MFRRLNQDRQKQGLAPLEYDERLADVARYHAQDMRDHRFFSHDSPTSGSLEDRLNAAGYLFLTARENLSEAPDVQRSQDALLKSPPHHANIMSTDVTHVGIGIVKGGIEAPGNLMVTQVFATPGQEETPEAARDAMLESIQSARAKRGLDAAKPHEFLNELAERYIEELAGDASEGRLRTVGKSISREVAAKRDTGLKSVVVGGQLVPESNSFHVSERFLQSSSTPFGLSVRQVPGSGGRPMLQVLVLIGR